MSISPFDMFTIKNILVTRYFIINSIHVNAFIISIIFMLICIFFKKNIIYNIVFAIWRVPYQLLEVSSYPSNRVHMPFFFTIFLYNIVCNFLARVPGLLPMTSLLKVSLPINMLMIGYFLYSSLKINGIKIMNVFFDEHMILPIRLLIGLVEIISFLSKIFSFAMRILANLTAGHLLMWVVETFIADTRGFNKVIPLIFLVAIYLIEFFSAALQSYVFIVLSINTFRSVQTPHS